MTFSKGIFKKVKYRIGLVLLVILFASCANRFSKFYDYNSYVNDSYNYVINDSLKFLHKTYGDIYFERNKDSLLKYIPKPLKSLDNILLYGRAEIEPFYQYFLLLNSKKKWGKIDYKYYVKDTLFGKNKLTFIGFFEGQQIPDQDFNYIIENLEIGKDYKRNFIPLFELLNDCFESSNRYYQCLQKVSDFPTYNSSESSFKNQMQLTFASFLGDNYIYNGLLEKNHEKEFDTVLLNTIRKTSIQGVEIQDFLFEKLKNESLLMINENHFYPRHRLFLIEILPILDQLGFKYLALEALDNEQDIPLNNGEETKIETGFYTREQNFIQLIKEAQNLGMKIVAYDDMSDSKNRETNQAKNIYNKTFAKDSLAKVVVLAGISHILEKEDGNDKLWMAYHFNQKYSINPVTISQTALNKYSSVVSELALLEPVSLNNKRLETTDFIVINNLKKNIPQVNFTYENKFEFPVQLSIFFKEPDDRKFSFLNKLPIQNFLLDTNDLYSTFLEPNHEYTLVVFDGNGKVVNTLSIDK